MKSIKKSVPSYSLLDMSVSQWQVLKAVVSAAKVNTVQRTLSEMLTPMDKGKIDLVLIDLYDVIGGVSYDDDTE